MQIRPTPGCQLPVSRAEYAFTLLVNHLLRLGDAETLGLIPAFKNICPDHYMGLAFSVDDLLDTGRKTVLAAFGHEIGKDFEPFVRDRVRPGFAPPPKSLEINDIGPLLSAMP